MPYFEIITPPLEPCPFCKHDLIFVWQPDTSSGYRETETHCGNCRIVGPSPRRYDQGIIGAIPISELVVLWNMRDKFKYDSPEFRNLCRQVQWKWAEGSKPDQVRIPTAYEYKAGG